MDTIKADTRTWRRGFAPLLGKELGRWWRTRLWWVQLLIWTAILNGITTILMIPDDVNASTLAEEAVLTFFLLGAAAIAIGVIITLQGAVVGEKELGTAAWVMSKPATRSSFILTKLIAHALGLMITALIVPAVVFCIEAELILPGTVPYARFAAGVGVQSLVIFYYLALTLALGAACKSRGPVAGVGLALVLFGVFFKGMLPLPVVLATPWLLGDIAGAVALNSPLDGNPMIPVGITTAVAIAYVVIAMWRFGREEF